jgi:hypothetical protein
MGLYHVEVYMPRDVVALIPTDIVEPFYSGHAVQAAASDRYGEAVLAVQIDLKSAKLIEAEVENGKLLKYVVRCHYDNARDIIYVLCPRFRRVVFVKTVWFNLKTDKHRTLDKNKYVRA